MRIVHHNTACKIISLYFYDALMFNNNSRYRGLDKVEFM